MEKLSILRQAMVRSNSFVKKEDRIEDMPYTHLPNNDLMELIKQIKNGDTKAMETVSAQYVRLVIDIANDFKEHGLTDLELILKGNAGLIKAAENYDVSRGIEFGAYATWAVRQAIIQAIDEHEHNRPMPLNKIGLLHQNRHWGQNHKQGVGIL